MYLFPSSTKRWFHGKGTDEGGCCYSILVILPHTGGQEVKVLLELCKKNCLKSLKWTYLDLTHIKE